MRFGKILPAFILFVCGALLTCFLVYGIQENERRQITHRFNDEAQFRCNALESAFERFHADIAVVNSFFKSSECVTREEFTRFIGPLVSHWKLDYPSFTWVPRVIGGSAFDSELTPKDEIASLQIFMFDKNGNKIPAPSAEERYPILYYAPSSEECPLIGFDIKADPVRRAILHKARDVGSDLLIGPIPFLVRNSKESGFLIVSPIYKTSRIPERVEDRRKTYAGALVGWFAVASLIKSALQLIPPTGLSVELINCESKPYRSLYRFMDAGFSARSKEAYGKLSRLHIMPYKRHLKICGRDWAVVVRPSETFVKLYGSNEHLIVFRGGLLISILISLYFYTLNTNRERAEMTVIARTAKLAAAEARFRAIIESTDEAIVLFRRDGTIEAANSRFSTLYNVAGDSIVGANIETFFQNDTIESNRERIAAVFNNGKPVFTEECRSERWYSIKLFPIFNERKNVESVAGFIRDITEEKHRENEKREFQARLQHMQKLESLGILAGGIAHDFNNLLTAILGYTEVLAMCENDQTVLHTSTEIRRTALQAGDLCRQLLAYSGKGFFEMQRISLRSLIEEMKPMLMLSASKKIVMKIVFEKHIPEIEADPSQIRQILMNLIMNASEAIGDKHGQINVRVFSEYLTTASSKQLVNGYNMENGEYAVVEVSDNGCGIEPTLFSRIFDPFFSTKFTGRGLGLATVLGTVRSHKGGIYVKSFVGRGTIFRVFLPAVTSSVVPAALPIEISNVDRAINGKILLVDDEEIVRNMTAQMLTCMGCEVVSAANAEEALILFGREPQAFAFALIDMTMPEKSGDELFRELRAVRSNLPVIVFSGYSESEIKKVFDGATSVAFLAKPFLLQTLKNAIASILPNSKP